MPETLIRPTESGPLHSLFQTMRSLFLPTAAVHSEGNASSIKDQNDLPVPVITHLSWPARGGFASVTGPRAANEDSCYANVRDGIFLVADGVGGNRGGALASQLLVDTIPPFLAAELENGHFSRETLPGLIRQAVNMAQREMSEIALCEPSVAKMGSTIVLGVIAEGALHLTHLGDSRAYLVRRGTIRQLTKDHSWVQAIVDSGAITREQAEQHPFRHVILECVSAARLSKVDVVSHELLPDDRLLFATDGLTNVVDEEMLGWIITRQDDPQLAADELIREALDRKTRDNATCLVVHFLPSC